MRKDVDETIQEALEFAISTGTDDPLVKSQRRVVLMGLQEGTLEVIPRRADSVLAADKEVNRPITLPAWVISDLMFATMCRVGPAEVPQALEAARDALTIQPPTLWECPNCLLKWPCRGLCSCGFDGRELTCTDSRCFGTCTDTPPPKPPVL